MKKIKLLTDIFTKIVLLTISALGLIFLLSLLPIKNNFKLFLVQSGSMEPTIKTGSLILVKAVSNYVPGDIVTRKAEDGSPFTITHRIVERQERGGRLYFHSKGDANNSIDSESFSRDKIVGKVLFKIPLLGYLINFLKTTQGFVLLVVIPATILIYRELEKIAKKLKQMDWHFPLKDS